MTYVRTALDYLLPQICYLCEEACTDTICTACTDDFLSSPLHRCTRCGIEISSIDSQAICGQCLQRPPYFDQTIIATDYLPPADQLVQRLKFGSQLVLAKLMADRIRDAVINHYSGELPQLLSPVPLGPQRLIERGFNQAQEIARILAPQLGIDLAPRLLLRVRDTTAQSSLPIAQRHANTRNVFICNLDLGMKIDQQHIGVVDDVMTTGATLNEIAKVLKRYGARKITNFVFARTPRHA